MLRTGARELLDKYFSGSKEVSLADILKKQTAKKRDSPKKFQCNYCVYRDCTHNNTKEEDIPTDPNDWTGFSRFEGCFGCEDRDEQ